MDISKVSVLLFAKLLFISISSSLVAEPIIPLESHGKYNPEEVSLGKQLFNSELLSSDNTISCRSCHNVAEGGDDGLAKSIGINAQLGLVNAPTVLNSTFNISQFWDGRADSLASQVEGPIHNSLEMGSSWSEVIKKLKAEEEISHQFTRIYPDGINAKNIAAAIAAYEARLITLNAPFDRYLRGDSRAISEKAKRGYQMFKQMGCVSCHQGKNVGGNMYQHFGIMGDYFKDRGDIVDTDFGRYNVTKREEDRYKFKVPSLRNIENTGPYFHDGSVNSLDEAVRIMARYQLGRPITDDQVDVIKEFLVSLTGEVSEELM